MVAIKKYLPGFHLFLAECLKPFAALDFSAPQMPAIRLPLLVWGTKGRTEECVQRHRNYFKNYYH